MIRALNEQYTVEELAKGLETSEFKRDSDFIVNKDGDVIGVIEH